MFRAELITNELLANALEHAAPSNGEEIVLYIAQDHDGVLIEVEDGGCEQASLFSVLRAGPVGNGELEHGRGLLLIEALVQGNWGWRRHGDGHHSVWAYIARNAERGTR